MPARPPYSGQRLKWKSAVVICQKADHRHSAPDPGGTRIERRCAREGRPGNLSTCDAQRTTISNGENSTFPWSANTPSSPTPPSTCSRRRRTAPRPPRPTAPGIRPHHGPQAACAPHSPTRQGRPPSHETPSGYFESPSRNRRFRLCGDTPCHIGRHVIDTGRYLDAKS